MSEHDQETETQEKEASTVALPGHRLKLTREDLHLSKDEVAHHLHLDVNIVEALETDKYDDLPSPAYICGYLRSYARILKLPEDEIVSAYSKGQEINAALIPETVSMEPEKKINPGIIKFVVLILIALLVAAGFMWFAEKFQMFDTTANTESTTIDVPVPDMNQPEMNQSAVIERPAQVQEQIQQFNAERAEVVNAPSEDSASSSPLLIDEDNVAVEEAVVPEQAERGDLKLVVSEDSWVEVTDSEDKRLVYRLAAKNTEISVNGVAPYTILLGNAEGVAVFYKNKLFNHKRYQRDQIAYFRLGLTEE